VTASVTITSDKKLIFDERGLRAVIIEKLDVEKKRVTVHAISRG